MQTLCPCISWKPLSLVCAGLNQGEMLIWSIAHRMFLGSPRHCTDAREPQGTSETWSVVSSAPQLQAEMALVCSLLQPVSAHFASLHPSHGGELTPLVQTSYPHCFIGQRQGISPCPCYIISLSVIRLGSQSKLVMNWLVTRSPRQ